MEPDQLSRASKKLMELELKINIDDVLIDILWFRAMMCEGDWCIGRHRHSSFEFHFIHSGKCLVKLDDCQFQAEAGEFYLTAPGVNHEQRGICGQHIEFCLSCDITVGNSDTEFKDLVDLLIKAPCKAYKDMAGIDGLFIQALQEAEDRKTGFLTNIKNIAVMLITAAARSIQGDRQFSADIPVKSTGNVLQLKQLQRFITDNIFLPISVLDAANHLHMSTRQLNRLTMETCGQSPKDLIMSSKLKKAKQLLLESDYSIKEISNLLGFSSEFYFSQFFKREEGYTAKLFKINARKV